MKILQTNLQRKASAHDAAYATAKRNDVDLLVVAEPNIRTVSGAKWMKDENTDVAVLLINRKLRVHGMAKGAGRIIIYLDSFCLICCYISPNISIEIFSQRVEEIFAMAEAEREVIIVGDINAKSPAWGSPIRDRRGEIWMEWLGVNGMEVKNDGQVPTWSRGAQSSYIDVTCATEKIAREIVDWRVLPDESLSDHRFILFGVGPARTGRSHPAWRTGPVVDEVRLRQVLREELSRLEGVQEMDEIIEVMKRAQRKSEIQRGGRQGRFPYWWNGEIERAREECIATRRKLTRLRRHDADNIARVEEREEEYKGRRRHLAGLIKKSKRKHWKDLCEELENDIFGKGYEIVTKAVKGNNTPYELTYEKKIEVAKQLFPRVDDEEWPDQEEDRTEGFSPFTREEILEGVKRLKRRKSPGPDGVTAETLKEAINIAPELFVRLYNDLARRGIFPGKWKMARLVLIWKGKMPLEAPTSQRPLCLLDVAGKLYEGLIRERIAKGLEEGEDLSNRQFGFRKGRSTIKAAEYIQNMVNGARNFKLCALVTLDIRNAFNTARWSLIIREVIRKGIDSSITRILRDYFNDRYIMIGKEALQVTTGVPQGSVLGPTLWNILYDGILRISLPEGVTAVAFADDLAIFIRAKTPEQLRSKGNIALRKIVEWMDNHALNVAPEKTEAIMLKGNRRKLNITFRIKNKEICPSKSLKYLGIMMDTRNTYGIHVQTQCIKAERRMMALARIMPNIGGPSARRRKLLYSTVQSIILYAAPVWEKVLKFKKYKERLEKTQRMAMLRVASAYRTVSTKALQVITGIPPIDLLVEERGRIHRSEEGHIARIRREERKRTLEKWQERWRGETTVAQWTKRLIPDIRAWYECEWRTLGYHLTQFLTGHGSFETYRKRIGKVQDSCCRYCGEDREDTPEHTLMRCHRWTEERREIEQVMGELRDVEEIVKEMMEDGRKFQQISSVIKRIMEKKEEEERGS